MTTLWLRSFDMKTGILNIENMAWAFVNALGPWLHELRRQGFTMDAAPDGTSFVVSSMVVPLGLWASEHSQLWASLSERSRLPWHWRHHELNMIPDPSTHSVLPCLKSFISKYVETWSEAEMWIYWQADYLMYWACAGLRFHGPIHVNLKTISWVKKHGKKRSICKTRDVQVKSSRPRLAKNNLSEDEDGRWNSKDVLGNIDSPLNWGGAKYWRQDLSCVCFQRFWIFVK